jgi:hypothetical protein
MSLESQFNKQNQLLHLQHFNLVATQSTCRVTEPSGAEDTPTGDLRSVGRARG